MTRPTRVVIDQSALQHNYRRTQELARGARIIAVVKADAYGHGLVRVAKLLPDADAFGVACLEEAEQLRQAGVGQAIVLLEGPYTVDELPRVDALRLDMVLHTYEQLDMLAGQDACRHCPLWLKIDTGMHRLGFPPSELPAVLERCKAMGWSAPLRLMSHLAAAHELGHAMNQAQLRLFQSLAGGPAREKSIANSAALLTLPDARYDWVRPGLMLYGVSPVAGHSGEEYGLRPAMTLESALIAVRRLQTGEPVGYSAAWRCPEDMSVGVLAAGYADGYPRHAANGTPVLINGRRCALIGHASMDMLTVDLRNCPQAKTGDPTILWGPGLAVEEIAQAARTVPYELLCGVHKRLSCVSHAGAPGT